MILRQGCGGGTTVKLLIGTKS